jgi:segregation and condensation protein A
MTAVSVYTIHLPIYNGPLDLLLELIERAELDITKVSLAKVTNQYLEYIRQAQEIQLADLASFLIIAARLIQIKSEALLPRPPEREPGELDVGDALARQLIAYKRYKEIANQLASREKAGLQTYLRLAPLPHSDPILDLSGISLTDLHRAILEALAANQGDGHLNEVIAPPKINIRDHIQMIIDSLHSAGKTTFWSIIKQSKSRIEIAVSFIAILELVKLRKVTAQQNELFGEITIMPGETWNQDQEEEFELEFDE